MAFFTIHKLGSPHILYRVEASGPSNAAVVAGLDFRNFKGSDMRMVSDRWTICRIPDAEIAFTENELRQMIDGVPAAGAVRNRMIEAQRLMREQQQKERWARGPYEDDEDDEQDDRDY